MLLRNTLPVLALAFFLPVLASAQADRVSVENLSYDYDSTEGIIRNFAFDIIYNGSTVRKGFDVYANLFRLDNGKGPYVPVGKTGLGGTGGGSEKRSISFDRIPMDLNKIDSMCNGEYRITVFIPDYQPTVYRFDDNEDKVINYTTGGSCEDNQEKNPSSVNRVEAGEELSLYPSPVAINQELVISAPKRRTVEEMAVYSVTGETVVSKNPESGLTISPDLFAPGIYHLKVTYTKGYTVKRFSVVK